MTIDQSLTSSLFATKKIKLKKTTTTANPLESTSDALHKEFFFTFSGFNYSERWPHLFICFVRVHKFSAQSLHIQTLL